MKTIFICKVKSEINETPKPIYAREKTFIKENSMYYAY